MATREAVCAALFALVDAAAGGVVGLKTSSRRPRGIQEVDTAEMPALFMLQLPEEQQRTVIGLPAKRIMKFEVWLYTADAQEDSIVPVQQLNAMVDAIEVALNPDATTGILTLGGLVVSTRIDGNVEYVANLTNDGKSLAVIPIAVIRP